MDRVYLDYASSTPVDPRVFDAMKPYFTEKFGNSGSLHSFGQEAIAAVDKSRETIARLIGVDFRNIIFTASATEANNMALRGVSHVARRTTLRNPKIIISAIEHESILETAKDLIHEGIEVAYLPVDRRGIVDIKRLAELLDDRTVLVSVMYANNEIGTIEPLKDIAQMVGRYRKEKASSKNMSLYPVIHTDAAQAAQFLSCNPEDLSVDLMTLSSHKLYGPKGAAALYIREKNLLPPLVTGGGQEFGLRSGTENVPAIVGFAKAFELAASFRDSERVRIGGLKIKLWQIIKDLASDAEVNGADIHNSMLSLPNILDVYFPGRSAQDLLTKFDLAGLAVSSGSACRSRAFEKSYVITELGYDKERTSSSIRFSLGRPTTDAEITRAGEILGAALA